MFKKMFKPKGKKVYFVLIEHCNGDGQFCITEYRTYCEAYTQMMNRVRDLSPMTEDDLESIKCYYEDYGFDRYSAYCYEYDFAIVDFCKRKSIKCEKCKVNDCSSCWKDCCSGVLIGGR